MNNVLSIRNINMESITNTLHNITEGFTATSEAEILPIYYGNELANGAAYTAYRFKRFMNHAGAAAIHAIEIADKVTYHIANN